MKALKGVTGVKALKALKALPVEEEEPEAAEPVAEEPAPAEPEPAEPAPAEEPQKSPALAPISEKKAVSPSLDMELNAVPTMLSKLKTKHRGSEANIGLIEEL